MLLFKHQSSTLLTVGFQQHMRLPIDNDCLTVSKDEEEEVQFDKVIGSLLASREKVFGNCEFSITKAQGEQKDTYRKHQLASINVGEDVLLLENTSQKQRKGGKLEPAWLGQYVVSRCVGKGLYELSRNGKVIKKRQILGD